MGRVLLARHKPSWQFGYEYEREQQALAAARLLEQHAPEVEHTIVLGGFDATPDATSMRFWRGRQSLDGMSVCYQDAWETAHPDDAGFTFISANPLVRAGEVATAVSRRIDYILVGSGQHGPTLQVSTCERVLESASAGGGAGEGEESLHGEPCGTPRRR